VSTRLATRVEVFSPPAPLGRGRGRNLHFFFAEPLACSRFIKQPRPLREAECRLAHAPTGRNDADAVTRWHEFDVVTWRDAVLVGDVLGIVTCSLLVTFAMSLL
jgi:hypothetical protein